MTDRESFLAAIKANPNDDIPRLVFADWLEEHAECDRDVATAEFIRISCTLDAKQKVASIRAGNWMDGWKDGWKDGYIADAGVPRPPPTITGVRRLVPKLYEWVDQTCALGSVHDPHELFWNGYPYIETGRKGRWVEVRSKTSPPVLPEIVNIEFWRGFVRRVEVRHWSMADEILPLLLEDQPLIEPEIRGALRARGVGRWSARVWGTQIGPAAERYLMRLKEPFRPDRDVRSAYAGNPIEYTWLKEESRFRHRDRARWAIVICLRAAAKEIMNGWRKPDQPITDSMAYHLFDSELFEPSAPGELAT